GAALALSATASLNAPLTITNVEFFYDGTLVAADSSAPYSASVGGTVQGNQAVRRSARGAYFYCGEPGRRFGLVDLDRNGKWADDDRHSRKRFRYLAWGLHGHCSKSIGVGRGK